MLFAVIDSSNTAITAAIGAAGVIIIQVLQMYLNWKREQQDREWKRKDLEYKRTVEISTEHAAKKAEEAARLVALSKVERAEQMKSLEEKLDENTEISKQAFSEANGVNAKIKSIGIEVARNTSDKESRRADVAIAYASGKAIALQEHANERLDEIAQNASPTQQLT